MKSHTVRFILKELAHLKLKLSGCWIVPNPNSFVDRTSGNQILFDANIHSLDSSGVEREDCKFKFAVIVASVHWKCCFHYLIIFSCEHDLIVRGGKRYAFNFTGHDTCHEIFELWFIFFVTLLRDKGAWVVGIFGLFGLFVDVDLTTVSTNHEALTKRLYTFNMHAIAWRF